MKKAIFFGLFFGVGMLLAGFWLGMKANTPEVEVSVSVEEVPQARSESPATGVAPNSVQKPKTVFNLQTKEEEEPEDERTEVVQSETQKKLAELGFSAKKFHKISTKR